jgi:hypothetical protein
VEEKKKKKQKRGQNPPQRRALAQFGPAPLCNHDGMRWRARRFVLSNNCPWTDAHVAFFFFFFSLSLPVFEDDVACADVINMVGR